MLQSLILIDAVFCLLGEKLKGRKKGRKGRKEGRKEKKERKKEKKKKRKEKKRKGKKERKKEKKERKQLGAFFPGLDTICWLCHAGFS
jgi:hypothetical protein